MSESNDCECKGWASDGRIPLLSHHYKCDKCQPVPELVDIIRKLIIGIEKWGGEEDGIYEGCFDAYKKAKMTVGQLNFIAEVEEVSDGE